MADPTRAGVRALLLVRRGLVFAAPGGQRALRKLVQAAEAELAAVGFVASVRLAERLATLAVAVLTCIATWARDG